MNFHTYIKAVGTGPKGNRDLSFDESKDMMHQILGQKVYSEQIAAFLLGWRLKPETVEEFRGALSACDSYIKHKEVQNSLELGYPFDGKVKNPYLLPLIAKELKNSELNLVITGDKTQPAKNGTTIKEIHNSITEECVHYFDREVFFNELSMLTEIRNRLGVRTGFNTIEKLSHVAKSEYAITGVFHKPYVKKYIDIFSDRYEQFALIQGNEGTPELFNKGTLWVSDENGVKEFEIDPQHYGINYKKSVEKIDKKESLEMLKDPSKELLELAKLNAAIYLFIAKKANSIDEAFESLGS